MAEAEGSSPSESILVRDVDGSAGSDAFHKNILRKRVGVPTPSKAGSSGLERCPHMAEVTGSTPVVSIFQAV